jgi:hypothetical protein
MPVFCKGRIIAMFSVIRDDIDRGDGIGSAGGAM